MAGVREPEALLERGQILGRYEQAARAGGARQAARQVDWTAVEVARAGYGVAPAESGADAGEVVLPLLDRSEQVEGRVGKRCGIRAGEHRRVPDHLHEPDRAGRDRRRETRELLRHLSVLLRGEPLAELGKADEIGEGDRGRIDAWCPWVGRPDRRMAELLADLKSIDVLEGRGDERHEAARDAVERLGCLELPENSLRAGGVGSVPFAVRLLFGKETGHEHPVGSSNLGQGHRHHPRALLEHPRRHAHVDQRLDALSRLEISLGEGWLLAIPNSEPEGAQLRDEQVGVESDLSGDLVRRVPLRAADGALDRKQVEPSFEDRHPRFLIVDTRVPEPLDQRVQPASMLGGQLGEELFQGGVVDGGHRHHSADPWCDGPLSLYSAGVPTPRVQIPVFELPLVLLPTERIPLHIFEARYRRMIAYCLEEEAPFGVLLRTDDGSREVGCAANVIEVLERFDDGRMNILIEGEYRFEMDERVDDPRFPMATIERLADAPGEAADPGPAREAFEQLLEALESDAHLDEDAETAFEIAARVEIPVDAKQELLETASEHARLSLLTGILGRLGEQVASSRALADRARGNGHGPISGLGPPEG